MDRETILREITKMAKYYGVNDRLDAEAMSIYVDHLQDMDYETFKRAVERHVESSEWMPKVSQIRQAAMQNLMKRAGVPAPAEAWGEVSRHLHADTHENFGTLTAVNRIGDHNWSHPIVKQAAEQIGWQDMWWSKNDNVASNRARYMDAYAALVRDLKDHYTLNPDLRNAIKPPEQPQLPDPKPEKKLTMQEKYPDDEYGPHAMPDHVREKWEEIKEKRKIK